MRFHSIRIRGFRPFTSDVAIDLSKLQGPIVAIHGPNGSGKSTLVELLSAGAYREMPTHGKLAHMATTRDAFLEVVVENGQRFTTRHMVDASTGKGEALVLGVDGKLVLKSTKVSEFDQWSRGEFPDSDVYFSGPFGAQQSSGLLDLTSGDRMAIILRALGIERYEVLAKKARDLAADSKTAAEVAAARLADETERLGDPQVLEEVLAARKEDLATAEEKLRRAKAQLTEAERMDAERKRLLATIEDLDMKIARVRVSIEAGEAILSEEHKIREASAQLERLEAKIGMERPRVSSLLVEVEKSLLEETRVASESQEAEKARESSGDRSKKAAKEVAELDNRIRNNQRLLDQGEGIRSASRAVEDASRTLHELEREVEQARGRFNAAESDMISWRFRLRQDQETLSSAMSRLESCERRLAEAPEVERAVASLEACKAAKDKAREDISKLLEELKGLKSEQLNGASNRIESLRSTLITISEMDPHEEAELAIDEANAALTEDDMAAESIQLVPSRIKSIDEAILAASEAESKAWDALHKCERLADKASDIAMARADIETAKSDVSAETSAVEKCNASIESASQQKREAQLRLIELDGEKAAVESTIARNREKAALLPKLEEATTMVEALRPQLELATVRHKEAAAEEEAARAAMMRSWDALETARESRLSAFHAHESAESDLKRLEDSAASAKLDANRLGELEAAIASRDILQGQLRDLEEERGRASEAYRGVLGGPLITSSSAIVSSADADVRQTLMWVQSGQADLERANAGAERVNELKAERASHEQALADWTLLAASLGREGIQAAEVDAATPELTELTNDLLHSCVGTRWTTRWETTRPDAKGKRQLEECRIRVIDTEEGGDRDGKEYSPGQRAVLELGCSLALTTFACRKLGIVRPTIVRDEADAPMTEEASAAYIPMLRRAAEMIGADKVLVISHHPHTVDLADSRIEVRDGTVRVGE